MNECRSARQGRQEALAGAAVSANCPCEPSAPQRQAAWLHACDPWRSRRGLCVCIFSPKPPRTSIPVARHANLYALTCHLSCALSAALPAPHTCRGP